MKELLDLPGEVLVRIAEYLDIQTAEFLSITCKALRPVAETRVWKHLHLLPWQHVWFSIFDRKPNGRMGIERREGTILFASNSCFRQPHRWSYIKRLELTVEVQNPHDALPIINHTGGNLLKLSLHDEDRASSLYDTREFPTFPRFGVHFAHLVHLDITLDRLFTFAHLIDILSDSPKLQSLSIHDCRYQWKNPVSHAASLLDGFDSVIGSPSRGPRKSDVTRSIHGPLRLTRLMYHFASMVPQPEELGQILAVSQELSHVSISMRIDLSYGYSAGRHGSLDVSASVNDALRDLPRLKQLDYWNGTEPGCPAFVLNKGFHSLSVLAIAAEPIAGGGERLEFTEIPAVGLKALLFYYSSMAQPMFLVKEHLLEPPSAILCTSPWTSPTRGIPPDILRQLKAAPNLEVIQYCPVSDLLPRTRCPTEWVDTSTRGVLVRSYKSGYEELYHCRTLSDSRPIGRAVPGRLTDYDIDLEKYSDVGARPYNFRDEDGMARHQWFGVHEPDNEYYWQPAKLYWEDAVDYGGYRVPSEVMDEAFEAGGLKWREETNPLGRGLQLPEETWHVLRRWSQVTSIKDLRRESTNSDAPRPFWDHIHAKIATRAHSSMSVPDCQRSVSSTRKSTILSNSLALKPAIMSSSDSSPSSPGRYLPSQGQFLRLLTGLQNTSAVTFSVFLGVHLAAPLAATFGGLGAADKTLLLSRNYYLPLEPYLIFLPLAVHLTSGLTKRLILSSKTYRIPRNRQVLAGYLLLPFLLFHLALHRFLPQQQDLWPEQFGFEFVSYGLRTRPILMAIGYLGIVGVGLSHAVVGGMKIASWWRGSRSAVAVEPEPTRPIGKKRRIGLGGILAGFLGVISIGLVRLYRESGGSRMLERRYEDVFRALFGGLIR
ncbi:hypothetical protein P7C73_g37, partial [Tremellales sp. Uapishka_1]